MRVNVKILLVLLTPVLVRAGNAQSMRVIPLSESVNPNLTYGNANGMQAVYNYLDAYTSWLTTQEFTTLVCPNILGSGPGVTDKQMNEVQKGFFGSYDGSGKFTSASDASKNKQAVDFAKCITNGVYQINKDKLQKGLQAGAFTGSLVNRMLMQEVLLGRIAMTATAVQNAQTGKTPYFTVDEQKVLSDFVTSTQQAYKQTRYFSSGFTQQQFSPVDFFAGVIVINKINNGITAQDSSVAVTPNSVGFIPVSGSVNNWANTNQNPSVTFERGISLRPTSVPDGGAGSFLINVSLNDGMTAINIAGNPVQFDKQSAFFNDITPWVVIIEFNPNPEVKGLAKLNILDFGDQIKITGMSQSGDTQGQSSSSNSSTFTLKDIINAPYELYKKTHVDGFIENYGTVKNYPFVNWFLQALFNGHLESSKYQVLTNLHGNLGGGSSGYTRIDIPWGPQPLWNNYFAVNSGIDWKCLRSLRVTKAIFYYSFLKKDALTFKTMENILNDPTKDYSADDAPKQGSNYSYLGWQQSASNNNQNSSSSNGKQVYIGATNNYLPVVLVQKQNTAQSVNQQK